jgi:hypothetical protein
VSPPTRPRRGRCSSCRPTFRRLGCHASTGTTAPPRRRSMPSVPRATAGQGHRRTPGRRSTVPPSPKTDRQLRTGHVRTCAHGSGARVGLAADAAWPARTRPQRLMPQDHLHANAQRLQPGQRSGSSPCVQAVHSAWSEPLAVSLTQTSAAGDRLGCASQATALGDAGLHGDHVEPPAWETAHAPRGRRGEAEVQHQPAPPRCALAGATSRPAEWPSLRRQSALHLPRRLGPIRENRLSHEARLATHPDDHQRLSPTRSAQSRQTTDPGDRWAPMSSFHPGSRCSSIS